MASERKRRPSLQATLVLTTNQEPPEELVRDTTAAPSAHGIAVDIWSVALLADFLDNTAQGQWLRYKHLGIDQELLSRDLLAKLSRDSVRINVPPDRPEAWVSRSLDRTIVGSSDKNLLFVIGGSGLGKSVACYKQLMEHIDAGGYGLILPHNIIASALALDEAIDTTLRRLHPTLAPEAGLSDQQFCSADHPLLLVAEDINKSGQAPLVAEKLVKWAGHFSSPNAPSGQPWRLLCPVWPQVVASLSDENRKQVQHLAVVGEAFSPSEGKKLCSAAAELAAKP